MQCFTILNISSFDCFFSIFAYFTISLITIFAAAKFLRG